MTADYLRERDRELRRARGDFDRLLRMMSSRDPQRADDGRGLLAEIAPAHVRQLLDAYAAEADYRTKFLLLELLGETGSDEVLAVVAAELANEDEVFARRAAEALERIGTKEARRLLWNHRQG